MRKGFYRQFLYKFTRMPCGSMFLLLFLGGFLGGILFANAAWNIRPVSSEALNLLSLGAAEGVRGREYLGYLAGMRLKAPVFLMILGLTSCGMAAVCLGLIWYGFLGGTLCSAALLQLGVSGMLKVFLNLLLPMICYVPATLVLLNQVYLMSEKSSRKEIEDIREYGKYVLNCIMIIFLYWAGILLECYVNPIFLDIFSKL